MQSEDRVEGQHGEPPNGLSQEALWGESLSLIWTVAYYVAFKILKSWDLAADVANRTVERVIRKRPCDFPSQGALIAYVKKVARREARRKLEREVKRHEVERRSQERVFAGRDPRISESTGMDPTELRERLRKGIRHLTGEDLDLLCLYYVENLTLEEIAQRRNMSTATAHRRMKDALENFEVTLRAQRLGPEDLAEAPGVLLEELEAACSGCGSSSPEPCANPDVRD